MNQNIFLGRQPILDRNQSVFGYELLFRTERKSPGIIDDYLATSSVIINTLSQIGVDNVLDIHRGFINVSEDVLNSDILDLLPSERIVLELLETVVVDKSVIDRCRELKAKGFMLAIDDFIYQPGYESLFSIIDYVKFDILAMPAKEINVELDRLSKWPHIKFLAEKVEDRQQFEHYYQQGFALFQGYFFARPLVMARTKLNPTHNVLLKILNMLQHDMEIDDLYNTFKACPQLGVGLLRLVNSAGSGQRLKFLR